MANTSVSLVGLDFDSIKSNLKSYLKRSDSPFKDVDFDGSNISQLLDVLSYNTYLNNYYLNMVSSEMFLDSAQLRDSIVSHAKELNYVPRSYRSSHAVVQFTLDPGDGTSALIVPKGTSFTTKISSNTYSFVTDQNLSFIANNSGIFDITLDIYEGAYVTDTYVYNRANTVQRFVISNPNVDTTSITVNSIENSGANIVTYSLATSFLGLTSNTNAYFLQAAENEQYEIVFGDDVISRQPRNASTIVVQYRTCSGDIANGARTFDIDGAIQGYVDISSISTTSPAYGGDRSESNNSIKFSAVRHYQNQERAVTPGDYEALILNNFPEVQAVSAFGGEDLDPPVYGKVYVAIDTYNSDGASDIQKQSYKEFLKSRCSISIDPVIANPDFLYMDAFCEVNYDLSITSLKNADIESIVKATISTYNTTDLAGFKKSLRYSQLVELINNAHPSIISNDLSVTPWKKLVPILNTNYSTSIDFGFEITNHIIISKDDFIRADVKAVYSTPFRYNGLTCTLQDDNNGNVGIWSVQGFEINTLITNVGNVNYSNGKITLSNFNITSYNDGFIKIYVLPATKDIATTRNSLVEILDQYILVNANAIRV